MRRIEMRTCGFIAFVYKIPSGFQNREYDVISYGRDRQPNGTGGNADVSTVN